MLQRNALQKFHRNEGLALYFPNVMNCADVGMVQGRRRLRLSLKTRKCLWVFRYIVGEEFQCHKAMKPGVLCLVNDTHTSTAKFFKNAIVRKGLADVRAGT